ncbi:hypothetical protein N665_0150s0006 [Sinapis alba]|nr:hypothetical protein N665_0150s0006 [Sinapis alba]
MVETKRVKKRKENPTLEKEKKAKSSVKEAKVKSVRVKFVRAVSPVSSTALEKRTGTTEQTETMALKKTTMTGKTTDESKPINVLVDAVAAVEVTKSENDKTDTDDNEQNSTACDEENEREDTACEDNVDEPDGSNENNENAEEEEESKEVEESEEEVGKVVANNVEESGDESGNADDFIGDGNVREVRGYNANEENQNPWESNRDHEELTN